jgi:hypothetical protein
MASSYFRYKNKRLRTFLSSAAISAIFIPAIIILTNIRADWVLAAAFFAVSTQSCIYFATKGQFKALTRLSSISVSIILVYNYILSQTYHPWILYPAFPLVWLFLMTFFTKQTKTFWFALFSASTGILYYGILNFLLTPNTFWFIYPSFALIWWPLAVFYTKTKKPLLFSLPASLLTMALFVGINLLTSPKVLWSIFPIFALAWWPMSVYFIKRKRQIIAEYKKKGVDASVT